MKQILVCYDGSSNSDKALKEAIYYARKMNGEIELVYVKDEKGFASSVLANETHAIPTIPTHATSTMYPGTLPLIPESNNIEEEGETGHSLSQVDNVFREANVILTKEKMQVKTHLLVGKPSTEICNYAEEQDKDLIIVGSRDLNAIEKIAMRSTSEKIVKEATCPVLVVK
ncbi:universal stress protein [Litchfieldia alkalitelluris]|uniref:universal stress protein n=1 Tax=Litchfieldia alkalitelluris TaxID=304268 RepID=UPI001472873E|nr:universal stress protein [Litchfieldia alkalitelluris]